MTANSQYSASSRLRDELECLALNGPPPRGAMARLAEKYAVSPQLVSQLQAGREVQKVAERAKKRAPVDRALRLAAAEQKLPMGALSRIAKEFDVPLGLVAARARVLRIERQGPHTR